MGKPQTCYTIFTISYRFSTDPAIHIKISSTIPVERGMVHAVAAVAVARALFAHYEKILTDKELWEIVQSSEKIAHGNPSGIDAATTSGKSPVFFIKNQPMEPLELKLSAYLVVADTGGDSGNDFIAYFRCRGFVGESQRR